MARERNAVATRKEKSAELPEMWLELAKNGQETAVETLREFVDTVEKAVPSRGAGLAKQREIIHAAVEMAQAMVRAQYNVMRSLARSSVLVNVEVDTDVGVDVDVDVASREAKT